MTDLPTEKQLAFLSKRNYSGTAPTTKQEASEIISKILGVFLKSLLLKEHSNKLFSVVQKKKSSGRNLHRKFLHNMTLFFVKSKSMNLSPLR